MSLAWQQCNVNSVANADKDHALCNSLLNENESSTSIPQILRFARGLSQPDKVICTQNTLKKKTKWNEYKLMELNVVFQPFWWIKSKHQFNE